MWDGAGLSQMQYLLHGSLQPSNGCTDIVKRKTGAAPPRAGYEVRNAKSGTVNGHTCPLSGCLAGLPARRTSKSRMPKSVQPADVTRSRTGCQQDGNCALVGVRSDGGHFFALRSSGRDGGGGGGFRNGHGQFCSAFHLRVTVAKARRGME